MLCSNLAYSLDLCESTAVTFSLLLLPGDHTEPSLPFSNSNYVMINDELHISSSRSISINQEQECEATVRQ